MPHDPLVVVARRSRVLNLPDLVTAKVDFTGLGVWEQVTDLYVRVLGSDSLGQYKAEQIQVDPQTGKVTLNRDRDEARLAVRAACTVDGEPYFEVGDAERLAAKDNRAVERIYRLAAELNELEGYRQKKDATTSSATSTTSERSPSPSAAPSPSCTPPAMPASCNGGEHTSKPAEVIPIGLRIVGGGDCST